MLAKILIKERGHFSRIDGRGTNCVREGLHYSVDECKTHLCFEFISHVILRILYPYSCKTHKIPLNLVL